MPWGHPGGQKQSRVQPSPPALQLGAMALGGPFLSVSSTLVKKYNNI